MKRRSRRFFAVAFALGMSLLSPQSMTPGLTLEASGAHALTAAAGQMSGTSWQSTLMAGRW